MKKFIAILTGLHVLAHSVFGCCEHRLDVTPATATPEVKTCCCHHGAHVVQHRSAPGASDVAAQTVPQRSSHQCIHSSCHWLAASAGRSIELLDFSVPVAIVDVQSVHGVALHSAAIPPDNVLGRTSAPPLRLHLVIGVLLV